MTDALQSKAQIVRRLLKKMHPDAHIELNFSSPLELLVATILSAQCTDIRVNEVTAKLFKVLKTPEDYLQTPISRLEELIRPTGFFRNKAKNIRGAMEKIVSEHGGRVPHTMEELNALPGVGRKTANVVLGNAFDVPGLPVDTHVTRVANRIGLTSQSDAVKIEYELNELVPRKEWTLFSHLLIFHGRRICKARKPSCEKCLLTEVCDYYQELV